MLLMIMVRQERRYTAEPILCGLVGKAVSVKRFERYVECVFLDCAPPSADN